MKFNDKEKQILRKIANDSIAYGLLNKTNVAIDPCYYPVKLREHAACFVTLEISKRLRGCIGSLQAHQPLVVDVGKNAYSAAFCDPRFPPLDVDEFQNIDLHISVLTKPEAIIFASEDALLAKIRPRIDGLILSDGLHRGTFLPSVWQSLPDKKEFLKQLKIKAGLSADYWSESIRIERYRAEIF